MKRAEAIKTVLTVLSDELVVHANGLICRESFVINDRPQNFYMIGSMGLAASIGLGIAVSKPERKIVVFDGDGNVLMNMGTLAQIGTLCPENFYHFVFDNEVYGSTGNQPTLTNVIELEKVARASGYIKTYRAINSGELRVIAEECLKIKGPVFILVKVNTEYDKKIERVSHAPEEIKKRFMAVI